MKVSIRFDLNKYFDGKTISLDMPASLTFEQINTRIEEYILGEVVRYEVLNLI